MKTYNKILSAVVITVSVVTSAIAGFFDTNYDWNKDDSSEKSYNLTLVTAFPKNSPGHGASTNRFVDNVRDLSNGRINIKVYASGELVPMKEAFSAVSNGKADMYHGIEMFWPGVEPALNYFATVPFGMTPVEH